MRAGAPGIRSTADSGESLVVTGVAANGTRVFAVSAG
jgi:hypothetical protein